MLLAGLGLSRVSRAMRIASSTTRTLFAAVLLFSGLARADTVPTIVTTSAPSTQITYGCGWDPSVACPSGLTGAHGYMTMPEVCQDPAVVAWFMAPIVTGYGITSLTYDGFWNNAGIRYSCLYVDNTGRAWSLYSAFFIGWNVQGCADGGQYDAASGKCINAAACPAGSYRPDASGTTCSTPGTTNADLNADSCRTAHPVVLSTGAKAFTETDFADAGALSFTRYYNSAVRRGGATVVADQSVVYPALLSTSWTHSFSRWIQTQTLQSGAQLATVFRADGTLRRAQLTNATIVGGRQSWSVDAPYPQRLLRTFDAGNQPTGWIVVDPREATVETYNRFGQPTQIAGPGGDVRTLTYSDGTTGANGGIELDGNGNPSGAVLPANLLIRVTDNFGRSLTLGYDSLARLSKVTDPSGGATRYGYDATSNQLVFVTYGDGHTRQYLYNEFAHSSGIWPNAITGLMDENGNRLGTYDYFADGPVRISQWWADTAQTQSVDRSNLSFAPNSTTVTDGLGSARTTTFTAIGGRLFATGQSQPGGSGCAAASASMTYDANANVTSRADFNGNKSCFAYDTTRNLETARVEGFASGAACPANVATYTPAANTAQRKVQTQWHPDWRLPARIAGPKQITTNVYNGQPDPTHGNTVVNCAPATALIDGKPIAVLCKQVEQATTDATGASGFSATASGTASVTTFSYSANGQLLSTTGPRGNLASTDANYAADTTTYVYYASAGSGHTAADRQTMTDALGRVTQFTQYDGAGRPLTLIDTNGNTTTLAYTPRGWLQSRTSNGETTSLVYNNAGDLTQLTLADASQLTLAYDVAHRLTQITDTLGNKITYTLDALGNRTGEQAQDPVGTLKQSLSRAVDALNRVQQTINAPNTVGTSTWNFQFDANGNPTQITDPRAQATNQQFDALNRLSVQLQPAPTTGGTRPQTSFAYDGRDALTKITDPRNLNTTYAVDGLGNTTQEASPDRGTTNRVFDVAGNLISSTDARGKLTTYQYDALNRLTKASYATGIATVYSYDQGANGIGHLTGITDESGSTAYTYNALGRLLTQTTTYGSGTGAKTRTLAYTHGTSGSSTGHVTSVTYPSGNRINYQYDAAGRITSLTLNHTNSNGVGTNTETTIALLSNIGYQPFGPVNGWTWGASGSGHVVAKAFDLNGRITGYPLGDPTQSGIVRTVTYDAANRITNYAHVNGSGVAQPAFDQSFSYDNLDRLTAYVATATNQNYGYDLNGNRLSLTLGASTFTNTVAATSNRLTATSGPAPAEANTFDAAGNTTGNGQWTAAYSDRGRMKSLTIAGKTASYLYNGLEQRASKSGPTSIIATGANYYAYDPAGHLTGEYDANTNVIEETVYLADTPVIVLTQTVSGSPAVTTTTVNNVYADHLNAPQVITRATDHKMRWRWMPDPFGTAAPNENPAGAGSWPYNLRFPGQVKDNESGLLYNWNRYLDPVTGRYVSVDPIGLRGGINPFVHVGGNPVTRIDPDGRVAVALPLIVGTGLICYATPGCKQYLENRIRDINDGCKAAGDKVRNWFNSRSDSASGGAKDAPTTTTDRPTQEWIYGPESDPKINPDGSTKPNTWTSPDDYPDRNVAADKLDPFKPVEGRSPVTIPAGTDVQRGRTPGGEGPYNGSGGARETLIPSGLPAGSVGPWRPLP